MLRQLMAVIPKAIVELLTEERTGVTKGLVRVLERIVKAHVHARHFHSRHVHARDLHTRRFHSGHSHTRGLHARHLSSGQLWHERHARGQATRRNTAKDSDIIGVIARFTVLVRPDTVVPGS